MTDTTGFAVIRMAQRPCAIRCSQIVEIVPRVELTQVPDTGGELLGVINLRGRVVPVLDVRPRLQQGEAGALPPYQHLVIVNCAHGAIGLAVDEVRDVVTLPEGAIETPGRVTGTRSAGVMHLADQLVLVLEPDDLVHDLESN